MVEIHEFIINNISCDWEKKFCLFEWTLEYKQFYKSISFNSSIWFERRYNGLLSEIEFNKEKYLVFITSNELSKVYPSYEIDSHQFQSWQNPGKLCKSYFIENEMTWNDFKVIFMRFSTDDRSTFILREIKNNNKVFKKLYKTETSSTDKYKILAGFRFPFDTSRINEITELNVSINQKESELRVFVGQFRYYNLKGFIYILSILDLFKLFQDNDFPHDLSFNYNNKYLPIPCLPVLRQKLSNKFETGGLYSEFIDRANIFCIYVPPIEFPNLSIENYDRLSSLNQLIKISDTDFDAFNVDITLDDGIELPYDILAGPAYVLSSLKNYWPFDFFIEPFDYYDLTSMDSSVNNTDKETEERDHEEEVFEETDNCFDVGYNWEELGWDEKFEYEPERALNEAMRGPSLEDQLEESLSNPEIPSINGIPIDLYNIEFVEKFSQNIHFVCLSEDYVVLEINMGNSFDRQYLPIYKNLNIQGLEVYNGIFNFEHGGALSFSILENKNIYDHINIIEKYLGYEVYRTIKTKHFNIYFNLKVHNNYMKSGEPTE